MQALLKDGSAIICGQVKGDIAHNIVGSKQSHLTKFGVAVGYRKVEGQERGETVFCNCECWNDVAKVAMNLHKNDVVLCVGKIKTDNYTDKNGQNQTRKSLAVEGFFTQPAAVDINISVDNQAAAAAISSGFSEIPLPGDDDLPF